jgi:hypothetical protein
MARPERPERLTERRQERNAKLRKAYAVAAKIAIKYGRDKNKGPVYTEDRIKEFWDFEEYHPSAEFFRRRIRTKKLKQILKTSVKLNDEIWNEDFMHGVAQNAEGVSPNNLFFVSMEWYNNDAITEIINLCPFGGKKGVNLTEKRQYKRDVWMYAPVLEITPNPKSLSFMAGVLSCGKIIEKNGETFVQYRHNARKFLKEMGIPVEYEAKPFILISPVWPALFSLKMPVPLRERWMNLKNPCKSRLYCPILWRTYVKSTFRTGGIPYLKSRRTIYWEYKCEEGAMKKLEQLRFDLRLTRLDHIFRDMVQFWSKLSDKSSNAV